MEQQLKDLCIKVEQGSNLDVCLAKYTKPRLKEILDVYGEKMPTSAKKQDMADKAEEVIKAGILNYFTGEGTLENELMQSLCQDGLTLTAAQDFDRIRNIYDRGMIYLMAAGDDVEVVVPSNVAAIYDGIRHELSASSEAENSQLSDDIQEERVYKEADMDRTEAEAEVIKYARALARIYGVYPASQLKEVWDFNHGRGISPNDVKKALAKAGDSDGFYLNDSYIVNTSLEDIEAYCGILEKIERSDVYFYPPEEEVEAYAEAPVMDSVPEYYYIRSLLSRKLGSMEEAENVLTGLYELCVRDSSPAQVIEYLESVKVKFETLDEFNLFISLYTGWFYGNRIWLCKGYKPAELKPEKLYNRNFKLPADIDAGRHRKLGRNEPCPCGSGKKYKNCCAKYI